MVERDAGFAASETFSSVRVAEAREGGRARGGLLPGGLVGALEAGCFSLVNFVFLAATTFSFCPSSSFEPLSTCSDVAFRFSGKGRVRSGGIRWLMGYVSCNEACTRGSGAVAGLRKRSPRDTLPGTRLEPSKSWTSGTGLAANRLDGAMIAGDCWV